MIARVWHGSTPVARSEEYLELMRTVALADYKGTQGNLGAYVLHRVEGEVAYFYLLTFWESREAVKAFAGEDIGVAKYYDFDEEMLLELEPGCCRPRRWISSPGLRCTGAATRSPAKLVERRVRLLRRHVPHEICSSRVKKLMMSWVVGL